MTDTDIQAVDTPAPDANAVDTAEPEVTSEAESSPAKVESKPEPDPVDRVRSRIDELTRLRREAERDRDFYREQALKAQQPQAKATEPEPVQTTQTLEDFGYDSAKYQEYLFAEAEKRAVAAAERRLKEQQQQESQSRRKSEFERKESDFAKSVDDYHEVTRSSSLPITAEMAEVIAESDDGPALAYYLGKNIPVAEQISRMSPLAAARELVRIEMKLSAERERAKEKPVSKAPPPAPRLDATESAASVSSTDPASDNLSDADWFKAEKKRLQRLRNRNG